MTYIFIIFLLVFLIYYNIYLVLTKPKRDLLKRLETYTKDEEHDVRDQSPLKADARNLRLSLKDIAKIFTRIDRLKGIRQHFDAELMKSGILLRGEEFIVILIVFALLFGSFGSMVSQSIIGLLLGVVIGLYLPIIFLKMKINKRRKLFNEQLGEVLTTMSNALRSGHSLMKALEVVSFDSPEPAKQEFSYTVKEMQLGISTEEALKNMSKRIASEDLELMITAILIQRQVGGNLAEVLDSIADTIRDRLRIQGEIKTLTAQGRLSGIIISFIPVAIGAFFYVVNPEYVLDLFTDPRGLFMITLAVVGQVIGAFVIKKIVSIEV
ncbi:type II secretion system F family protein [Natranaerofaba carboxydovora]|uniref:type II secretion system F family protein n=1 Tax=Natranaerofaba carboxydovora TaxID=2742683 RepID=UPI001F12D7BC|nr:type II secretion system F family protein [Natranaerofaba carboxydovora]UMZ75031.1 Type II secretion system (T2SS), protein F [Natranaerofaba carboxydovora]